MGKNSNSFKAVMLLLFLTFLNVLNFVDRQLIGTLGAPIKKELELSDAQFGLLVGLAFVTFYMLITIIMGTVADRWHRPRLIAIGLLLWSALTAVSGAARTFGHLFAARLFVGVGEATLTPAAISMLSDSFKAKNRALASGIFYAGIPLGVGASMLIAGELTGTLGWSWRQCFYILGGVGVVVASLVFFLKDPRQGTNETNTEATPSAPATKRSTMEIFGELFTSLRTSPALVLTIIGAVVIIFSQGAFHFLPMWLMREKGFDQQTLGRVAAGLFAGGGLIGSFLGGALSDICHKRWKGGRLYFIAVAQVVITPIFILFLLLPKDNPMFYICWFVGSFSITLLFGPVFSTVQDLVSPRIRSTAIAFLVFCLQMFGTAPGPYVAGKISDSTGDLTKALVIVFATGALSAPFFIAGGMRYAADVERLKKRQEAEAASAE